MATMFTLNGEQLVEFVKNRIDYEVLEEDDEGHLVQSVVEHDGLLLAVNHLVNPGDYDEVVLDCYLIEPTFKVYEVRPVTVTIYESVDDND